MLPGRSPSAQGYSVNVYSDTFESGETVQAYSVSVKETTKDLIQKVLRRNHLNLKDPNLFYLTFQIDALITQMNYEPMRVQNYTTFPTNEGSGKSTTGILYSNAILWRTLDLRKDNRLTLHMHPGQILRIYDSCFSKPPSIRQLHVSRTTCSEEVIDLVLKLVGSTDDASDYCLVEEGTSDKSRVLRDKDYPLLIARMNGPSAVLILQKREELSRSDKSRKKHRLGRSKTTSHHTPPAEMPYGLESGDEMNTCAPFNPFPFWFKGNIRTKAGEKQKSDNTEKFNFNHDIRSQSYSSPSQKLTHDHRKPYIPERSESVKNIPGDPSRLEKSYRSIEFKPQSLGAVAEKSRSAPTEMYQSGSSWSLAPSGFNGSQDRKSVSRSPTQRPLNQSGPYDEPSGASVTPAQSGQTFRGQQQSPYSYNTMRRSSNNVFSNYESDQKASKSHPDIPTYGNYQLQGSAFRRVSPGRDKKTARSVEKIDTGLPLRPAESELEQIWQQRSANYQYTLAPPVVRPRVPLPAPRSSSHVQPNAVKDAQRFRTYPTAPTDSNRVSSTMDHTEFDENVHRARSLPARPVYTSNNGRPGRFPIPNPTDSSLVNRTPLSVENLQKTMAQPPKNTYIPGSFRGVQNVIHNTQPKNISGGAQTQFIRNTAPETTTAVYSSFRGPPVPVGRSRINGPPGNDFNPKPSSPPKTDLNPKTSNHVEVEPRQKSKWNTVLKELNAEVNTLARKGPDGLNKIMPRDKLLPPKSVEPSQATVKPKSNGELVRNTFHTTINIPKPNNSFILRSNLNTQPPVSKIDMRNRPLPDPTGPTTFSTAYALPSKVIQKPREANTPHVEMNAAQPSGDIFSSLQSSTYPSLFDILHHCNILRVILDPNIPSAHNQLGLVLGLAKFPLDDIQRAYNLQRLKESGFKEFPYNGKPAVNGSTEKGSSSVPRPLSQGSIGDSMASFDNRQNDDAPDVVTVEAVIPNTPASIEGSLSAGMLLLEINGEPLVQTLSTQTRNLLRIAQQRLKGIYEIARQRQAPMVKITAAKFHNRFGADNKVSNRRAHQSENANPNNRPSTMAESKLPNSVITHSKIHGSSKVGQQRAPRMATLSFGPKFSSNDADSRSETTECSTMRNSDAPSLKEKLQWFPTLSQSSQRTNWA